MFIIPLELWTSRNRENCYQMCQFVQKAKQILPCILSLHSLKIQTWINMKIDSFSSNLRAWNTNFLNSEVLFHLSCPRFVFCELAFKLHLGNSLSSPRSIILQICIQTSFGKFFIFSKICNSANLHSNFSLEIFSPPNIYNSASLHSNFFLEILCFRFQRHVILWTCILDFFFSLPQNL